MLFDKNASILAILSSTGPGLFHPESSTVAILNYIKNICKEGFVDSDTARKLQASAELISKIESDAPSSVLGINTEKSFLLAHAFPQLFTDALCLVTDGGIVLEYWGENLEEQAVDDYMTARDGSFPVFVRVKLDQKGKKPISDPSKHLSRLLRPLGYKCELGEVSKLEEGNSNNLSRPLSRSLLPSGLYTTTDPYYWYCSCEEFHSAIVDSVCWDHSASTLAGEYELSSNLVVKFLENLPCLFDEMLPMCKHLLAVLLAALNWRDVRHHVERFSVESSGNSLDKTLP
ncbi:hypothetical protein PUMCH_003940 [Australozyma saopauloensis]|uniref:SWIM-type domain-containing protein n=1 Tax=Australozyma saopauloensis TaxID=291208 RepID=A0AAX4HD78_9ASCO|nr:hypothetical protein PUMCH_003940 [[Candida] saopauloensis]